MTKKDFINRLQEIRNIADQCLADLGEEDTTHSTSERKKRKKSDDDAVDYVLLIANKIKTCEESEKFDSLILDNTNVQNRILLPFYICYKYFPDHRLTSGDIEKITSELRIRIQQPNVSKNITKSLLKYLEGDTSRSKGKAVSYKLNRRGAKYFESVLQAGQGS